MKFTKTALAVALVAVAAIKGADAASLCEKPCGFPSNPTCHCERATICLNSLLSGSGKFLKDAKTSFNEKKDHLACQAQIEKKVYDAVVSGNPNVDAAVAALNNGVVNAAFDKGKKKVQENAARVAAAKAQEAAELEARLAEAARLAKIKADEEEAARLEQARLAHLARIAEEERLIEEGRAVHKGKLQHIFATEDAFINQRLYEKEKAIAIKKEELIAKTAEGAQWITANAEDVLFESRPPSHWYNAQVQKAGETFVFPFIRVDGVNAKGDLILTFPAGQGVANDGKVHQVKELTVADGWVKIKEANFVYTEDPAVVAARAAAVAEAQNKAATVLQKAYRKRLATRGSAEEVAEAFDIPEFHAEEDAEEDDVSVHGVGEFARSSVEFADEE